MARDKGSNKQMIQELYHYLIECDSCHSQKEISSIYRRDDYSFEQRMKETNGWTIIKVPWLDTKTYCGREACQTTAAMYIESKKQ
jgi:hypothetical protein